MNMDIKCHEDTPPPKKREQKSIWNGAELKSLRVEGIVQTLRDDDTSRAPRGAVRSNGNLLPPTDVVSQDGSGHNCPMIQIPAFITTVNFRGRED